MSQHTLLVVDDDPDILKILEDNLVLDGYTVFTATTGKMCLNLMESKSIDLVVLDLMLPDMDGIQVCRAIRSNYDVSIIILTARDQLSDKILGLESGADDYLVKPFDYLELVARIRVCLRRKKDSFGGIFDLGAVRINMNNRSIERNGNQVNLTKKEFQILELLIKNMGKVVERDWIKKTLWPEGKLYKWSRTIDVHIQHLRAKLGDNSDNPQFIVTIPGVGYLFRQPPDLNTKNV